MKERIISALIAIPIFLGVLLFAPNSLFMLFWLAAIFFVSYEFSQLRKMNKNKAILFSAATVLFSLLIFGVFPQYWSLLKQANSVKIQSYERMLGSLELSLLVIECLIWFIFVPVLLWRYAKSQKLQREFRVNKFFLNSLWFFVVAGFFIGLLAIVGILPSNNSSANVAYRLHLFFFFILIWANDAGAYFVGKAIGKRKFSPYISPNKTWEGFIGGIISSLVVGLILGFIHIFSPIFNPIYLYFAIPIAIFATVGDLFESMLKRLAGVKDSGKIMPGHGGIFDRSDSWLPVIGLVGLFGLSV